jgi:hypothetical protein
MYTKGPWIVYNDDGLPKAILPAGRPGEICNFNDGYRDKNVARLIAAAPELLEALKEAAAALRYAKVTILSDKYNAIIAKAEGRDYE